MINRSRGRGKHKCFWDKNETQLLIEVLQDIACDPAWKTDGGFRNNYMNEVHRRILVKSQFFKESFASYRVKGQVA